MKKLKISKEKLDLLKIDLHDEQILIGRSPSCDFVLRAKGIAPIHYLLEWIGQGDFDANKGLWTLYDISRSNSAESRNLTGEGVIVGPQGLTLNGLKFEWIEDDLSETHLDKGALGKSVKESLNKNEVLARGGLAIEVSRFKKEDQVLVNISHFQSQTKELGVGDRFPELKVVWSKDGPASLGFISKDIDKVTKLKSNTEISKSDLNKQINLDLGEVYKVETPNYEIYLRYVKKLEAQPVPLELFKDKFFLFSTLLLFITAMLVIYLQLNPPTPPIVEKKEERVVTIVEAAPPVQKVEPPPPPPKEEPPPPPPKAEPPPKPMPKQESAAPKKKSAAAAPTFKPKQGPPKTGLNAPAKVANVNAVGLLGKFKKKSGAGGESATVSAANLSQTFIDDAAVSESGRVVVSAGAAGVVGVKGKTSVGEVSLGEAPTTLQGSGDFNPENSGPLARDGGVKKSFTVGTGAGTKATKSLGGTGTSGTGIGSQEQVLGGLTREQVRKAINERRREIRTCYESALSVRNDLSGSVVYKWNISPEGNVTTIKLESSELKSSMAEGCIMGVIRNITFPKAPNGQPTTVIYPFVFQKT